MFCWETLGAGIYVNATWHTPPIQTLVGDQVHPLITTTLPEGDGPPQQDNAPWNTANTAQEQLEEHNKGPEVLASQFPPNIQDPEDPL